MPTTTPLVPTGRALAGESCGGYDVAGSGPSNGDDALTGMLRHLLTLTDQLEQLRLELADAWADVHAHGGLPAVSGWTETEWLQVVARLSRRDVRTLTAMTTRLPALPATAGALRQGTITLDQTTSILDATTGLTGTTLARVDTELAAIAAGRLARGDDPDVTLDAQRAVARVTPSKDAQRRERRQLDGPKLVAQSDLDGGGWLYAEYDPTGFATVCTAIDRAAGSPHPDQPRRRQRADGLVAMARAWLGGTPALPTDGTGPQPAQSARPSVTVLVDIADATASTFGELLRITGRAAPLITARLADTLACDAPLLVRLLDGARPLAELADSSGAVPAATRRAVLDRDRGCRWPSCTAPPTHVDVHHLVHRADGGSHDPDNLFSLCRRHHVRLHGPHWTATLDPTTATFTLSRRADGTNPLHTTHPAHRPPQVATSR